MHRALGDRRPEGAPSSPLEGLDPSGGFDVFVLQITPTEARNATYQARFRAAAIEVAGHLTDNAGLRGLVRHVALLDAIRTPSGLRLTKGLFEASG